MRLWQTSVTSSSTILTTPIPTSDSELLAIRHLELSLGASALIGSLFAVSSVASLHEEGNCSTGRSDPDERVASFVPHDGNDVIERSESDCLDSSRPIDAFDDLAVLLIASLRHSLMAPCVP
jgi:hypothetical protein